MNKTIRTHLDNIRSEDREVQNKAYTYILKATDKPVDWAYEAWDEMLEGLGHRDNHVRSIAAQALSNLAKFRFFLFLLWDIFRGTALLWHRSAYC